MARPYVDHPIGDLAVARAAAGAAVEDWGLTGELRLLRAGMNALFVAGSEAVVVRVGWATAPARLAHQLALNLRAAGLLVPEPIPGWTSDVGGLAVTAWRRVGEVRMAVMWEEVGAAVRRLHELPSSVVPEGYPTPSPREFPWWDLRRLLADVEAELDPAARQGLAACIRRNQPLLDAVDGDPVICHGDVHPGNVLMTSSGPMLIDWDLVCRADRAWDHAALATWHRRWGGHASDYRRFAEGYGQALDDRPLTVALGELRNVAATLLMVAAARHEPPAAAAAEAALRLRYWRGDPEAPMWTPR